MTTSDVSPPPGARPNPERSPVRPREPAGRDFVEMVGHELRGSLAVMHNVVRVCRSENGTSSLPNALCIFDRQTTKALRLVNDLLEHAWSDGTFSDNAAARVDMVAVVREVAEDLGGEIRRRRQRLDVRMPSEAIWVKGDAVRLGQIVWNLLDNASKCSEAGQRISIDLQPGEEWTTLGVHDEGIGIRPEHLPLIFSPYFRGSPARRAGRQGLGLGLTITRYFVMRHGGSIEAQSRGPGLGSDFTVRLPAAR